MRTSHGCVEAAARVFFGPQTEAFDKVLAEKPATDLRWSEKAPALLLLAGLLVLGFWPRAFSGSIDAAVTEVYAAAAEVTPVDVVRN